ncbi:MAG: hypothetical protein L3K26_09775, partial [Candidatus Hydrogenedentes bacterium]|nr:hypothetical protein [Candidatus Hydrogenedentota bacterium]
MVDEGFAELGGALVVFGAVGETLIDYRFKAEVAATWSAEAELGAFFALLHISLAVATWVFQVTLAGRFLPGV